MSAIPDFTDNELWVVKTTLKERYGKEIVPELADSEVRLNPDDRELTECPTLYWSERDAHFVIFKVAENCFRNQFFYSRREQYGTGRYEYDDLGDCVIALLRVQADHEATREKTG